MGKLTLLYHGKLILVNLNITLDNCKWKTKIGQWKTEPGQWKNYIYNRKLTLESGKITLDNLTPQFVR